MRTDYICLANSILIPSGLMNIFIADFFSNSLAERGVIITSASKIESDGYHKLLDFTRQALSKDVGRAHKNYSTGFLITGCLVPLHHYKQELF
jgi:hypothetical protein